MRKIHNERAGKTYHYLTVCLGADSELVGKIEELKKRWECTDTHLAKRAIREMIERETEKSPDEPG